jgi:hypothetical protein
MIKNILKSIGAGFTGILVGAILSICTDKILENMGVIPHGNLWVGAWIIIFVLFYRTLYNIIGSYVVARLAPNYPMRHVLVVGIIGTLVSIGGALATANMNLGPAWYAWTLAVLMLPSAWLGGKLYAGFN